MREIKFRANRIDNGKWMYGSYRFSGDKHYINSTEIHRETLGQYTGLKDRNGKKIFEGDVVSNGRFHGIVTFYDGYFSVTPLPDKGLFVPIHDFDSRATFSMIGNIHDNPELLEESEGED